LQYHPSSHKFFFFSFMSSSFFLFLLFPSTW
jgi:hypothetical protein